MKLIEIYVQMDFNNINNPILYNSFTQRKRFYQVYQYSTGIYTASDVRVYRISASKHGAVYLWHRILPAEQILWPDIRIQTDYGLSGYYSRSYKIIARFAQIAACDTAMYRRGTYYRNLHQPVKRLHERGFCLPYFG